MRRPIIVLLVAIASTAIAVAPDEETTNPTSGVEVPIPTAPPESAKYAEPLALIAVVEAYGNCDAAVDDEKNTPWVQMDVVVAAVEVPKLLVPQVNGAAPAEVWSLPHENWPLFQSNLLPALLQDESCAPKSEVVEAAPVLLTEKSVEVAQLPVDELITKAKVELAVEVGDAKIERIPNGEVVPIPRLPLLRVSC